LSAAHIYHPHELISRLRTGDKAFFSYLYNLYWEEMYTAAFYVLQDKEVCMDVVQDVFLWLWEHRQTVQIESPKAYLKAAVKFKIANYIRNGKVKDKVIDNLCRQQQAPVTTDTLELKELSRMVQQVVLELPEKCREIYLLSRQEQLSNKEIAEKLGLSVKTVENQMSIALRRIRRVVEAFMLGLTLLGDRFPH
jgi:RNA polymerase sigma-70 factor (ECF subfamily)